MKIDKDIPLPPRLKRSEPSRIAALMVPDDSVSCATEQEAAYVIGALQRLGHKGKRRRLEDGSYRVWRVA